MTRATPDFFGEQRRARRRTVFALTCFGAALAVLVAIAYGGVLLPIVLTERHPRAWHPGLLAAVAAVVLGTTTFGCVHHALALARQGVAAILEPLGAVALEPGATGVPERRLVDVVEEMAIAAGLPVPQVFVLEREPAINALAARTRAGAAVAVTRGALDRLSRDELQAIVAHELGHVLNGDSILNARLMGMLGGLTFLDLLGEELLRVSWSLGRWRWSAGAILVPTAVVLAIAGWVGVVCGQLVRCATSRQREYLADAAAAQFTRNPVALARALARIRDEGSTVRGGRALEASHFFFANALGGAWARWLTTHPPIEERIRRLDPVEGRTVAARDAVRGSTGSPRTDSARPERSDPDSARPERSVADSVRPARSVADSVRPEPVEGRGAAPAGTARGLDVLPTPAHVARARAILDSLPATIADAARSAERAPGLLVTLASSAGALSPEQRLVAADLALAAIAPLGADRLSRLEDDLQRVAAGDGPPTVFDWMLQRLVTARIERARGGQRGPTVSFRAVAQVQVECLEVLSLLAWSGTRDRVAARAALAAGLDALGLPHGWDVLPREKLDVACADAALRALARASPAVKERVLRACAVAAGVDEAITPAEAELLRVVAAILDRPLPPLLPGEDPPDSVHFGNGAP